MTLKLLMTTALTTAVLATAASAQDTVLRLSHGFQPDANGAKAAESFAQKVAERTEGRVEIDIYPAGQLGDWTETYQQIVAGSIDLGIQSLSTSYDSRLAIAWFPYTVTTIESAKEAFTQGGFIDEIVGEIVDGQNLELLGVVGQGMGGAGFATQIESPTDPNATRGVKIRVWPGGVTHQALMQRLGYNVATVPWAELYTAMQSGVVDGQIGSTAENSLAAFGEITKTWIQLNDHFEPSWIIANKQSFAALPDDDRAIVEQAAQEATLESFDAVTQANADAMDKFREMGAEVIVLDDAQLEEFARITREEVWPEIEDELGEELMARLREAVGL